MESIVTIVIIIACVVFSLYAFGKVEVFEKYMFNPYAIKTYKQHYRFLSHAFIHSSYLHLALNMFVLYSFGGIIEYYFMETYGKLGVVYYILLYTGAIYASSMVDYIRHKKDPSYNAVGASGAVSAIVFSMILIAPNAGLGILFIPVPIPAWIFGLLYLIYSFYMDRKKSGRVAHGAHAWGGVFGFLFTGLLNPSLFLSFIENIKQGL